MFPLFPIFLSFFYSADNFTTVKILPLTLNLDRLKAVFKRDCNVHKESAVALSSDSLLHVAALGLGMEDGGGRDAIGVDV